MFNSLDYHRSGLDSLFNQFDSDAVKYLLMARLASRSLRGVLTLKYLAKRDIDSLQIAHFNAPDSTIREILQSEVTIDTLVEVIMTLTESAAHSLFEGSTPNFNDVISKIPENLVDIVNGNYFLKAHPINSIVIYIPTFVLL